MAELDEAISGLELNIIDLIAGNHTANAKYNQRAAAAAQAHQNNTPGPPGPPGPPPGPPPPP